MTHFLCPLSLSVNNHRHLWPSFRALIIGPALLRHHCGGLVFVCVPIPKTCKQVAFCGSSGFRIAFQLETGMELKWSINWTVFCFNFQVNCRPKFWNCIGIDLVCAKVIFVPYFCAPSHTHFALFLHISCFVGLALLSSVHTLLYKNIRHSTLQ